MDIDKLIEDFNEGDHEMIKFFSDRFDIFFKVVDKMGKLDEIEINNEYADDYQNELLLYYYEKDPKKFRDFCVGLLGDVSIENDKIYVITDAEELSKLFCSNRDYSLETIEKVIEGNMDWDWYSDYRVDVMDYVIDDLDIENVAKLKDVILSNLRDKEINPGTEVLELIASEQGHIDFAIVTSDNIHKVYSDEETLGYLLEDYLEDIKHSLENLYHSAENTALQDDYYEEVWSELSTHFNGKPEWTQEIRGGVYDKEGKWKPNFVDVIKLEISDFDSIVVEYLNDNKRYGSSGTLEYQGSFMNLLKEYASCLRLSWPEYADSRKTIKYINEEFGSYI